ncbi:unnamed protein product [Triticum turgidum subsp. durum]|uniref:Protein kinase domain-containing protein n=1 Tax=Triticum turgidum subsp. durum TaxID=4567 RepID=A0A9R1PFP1_TRITD|nr:unnamed protein product [Triticum turgidum subsp. durum]
MGSGSRAASRKSTASSSSWRSLLDGCLGGTMAAGENVPASGGLEAMFLGELQLRHPCLVRMIGYCCEEEHRLLVYELMAHGSLDDYFFKPFYRPVLPWSTRLSIVLATAKGLVSLHGTEKPLICGEFNASDILLDSVGDHSASLALVKC